MATYMHMYSAHLLPMCLVWWIMPIILGLALRPQTHFSGETVHLKCEGTSVYWYHQLQFKADGYIVAGDHLTDGDRGGRLELSGSTLIIKNVNESDRGIYTCVDAATGHEVRSQVRLDVDVERSVVRKSLTAVIGGEVTLPCRTVLPTPVDWYYQPSEYEVGEFVCSAGTLINGYKTRFAIDRTAFGDFSLTIRNVTKADEGIYICREDAGLGMEHRITLNVKEEVKLGSHHIGQPMYPENKYLARVLIVCGAWGIVLFVPVIAISCCIVYLLKCRRPSNLSAEDREQGDQAYDLTKFCEMNHELHHTREEQYKETFGYFPESLLAKYKGRY